MSDLREKIEITVNTSMSHGDAIDKVVKLIAQERRRWELTAQLDVLNRLPGSSNKCTCQTCKMVTSKRHALQAELDDGEAGV